jgi:Tol biopolymer transport system component
MTDHRDDQLIRWLSLGPDHGPTAALEATFARLPAIRQRPGWLVGLGGGTVGARPVDRRVRLSLAVAVGILVLVTGGIFVAGSIVPEPDPSSTVMPSPTVRWTPSEGPAADVIVFTETRDLVNGEEDCTGRHCRRTWVAIVNADGAGQRRLFPDAPPIQKVIAVAADGSRMIVQGMHEGDDGAIYPWYYVTDLRGSEPQLLDTRCTQPCAGDWIGRFAFSPDGTRLAFVRFFPTAPGEGDTSVIAVMDLASGEVTLLESTITGTPALGDTEDPRWSPDGRQLVFSRSSVGNDGLRTIVDTELYIVDADGSNLRQLVPTELFARDAQWSPDRSQILFTSAIETLTLNEFGLLQNWHQLNDVYTVRPDGSDIRRLTSFTDGPVPDQSGDLGPEQPTWTRDGHIVFNRRVAEPTNPEETFWELWVMAADGTNSLSLGSPDAATLTEIGCVECAYPPPDGGDYPAFGSWRPNP